MVRYTWLVVVLLAITGQYLASSKGLPEVEVNGLDQFSLDQNMMDDARCVMCKFFVKKIHNYMSDPQFFTKINQTLMPICLQYLKFKTLCDASLRLLKYEFNRTLNQDLMPNYACPAAGFCPPADREDYILLTDDEDNPGMALCELCKYSAEHIEGLLDLLFVLGEVPNKLEDFCYQKVDGIEVSCPEVAAFHIQHLKEILMEGPLDPDVLCMKDLYICD